MLLQWVQFNLLEPFQLDLLLVNGINEWANLLLLKLLKHRSSFSFYFQQWRILISILIIGTIGYDLDLILFDGLHAVLRPFDYGLELDQIQAT